MRVRYLIAKCGAGVESLCRFTPHTHFATGTEKAEPANVLKIDHVLCDHHERVIRRAQNSYTSFVQSSNPRSVGLQRGAHHGRNSFTSLLSGSGPEARLRVSGLPPRSKPLRTGKAASHKER
jgi:hypothetical protein